jgi:hypothetical protein
LLLAYVSTEHHGGGKTWQRKTVHLMEAEERVAKVTISPSRPQPQ